MASLERVQVLLEPSQRRALARIAKREGRSVSDVLREMVDRGLEQKEQQGAEWKKALERLTARRLANRARGVYPGDLVTEGRQEREQQMDKLWQK